MKFPSSLLVIVCFLVFTACGKSFLEDNKTPIETEQNAGPALLSEDNYSLGKEVLFKIEGNYSGLIDMTVILHNDMPIVPITELNSPWERTFKIPDTSSLIGGYANAFYMDENQGEMASLQLYYEDRLLYNVIRESTGEGINLPLDTYQFKDHVNDQTATTDYVGKKVSYRVTSNSDFPVNIVYQVASGGFENVIVRPPFSHSFTVRETSMAASIRYGGTGLEQIGDKLTFELFIDDAEVQTSAATRTGETEYFYGEPIFYPFY